MEFETAFSAAAALDQLDDTLVAEIREEETRSTYTSRTATPRTGALRSGSRAGDRMTPESVGLGATEPSPGHRLSHSPSPSLSSAASDEQAPGRGVIGRSLAHVHSLSQSRSPSPSPLSAASHAQASGLGATQRSPGHPHSLSVSQSRSPSSLSTVVDVQPSVQLSRVSHLVQKLEHVPAAAQTRPAARAATTAVTDVTTAGTDMTTGAPSSTTAATDHTPAVLHRPVAAVAGERTAARDGSVSLDGDAVTANYLAVGASPSAATGTPSDAHNAQNTTAERADQLEQETEEEFEGFAAVEKAQAFGTGDRMAMKKVCIAKLVSCRSSDST